MSYLPIDPEGRVQVQELSSFIRAETALVSVLWANNETGVLTDVQTLSSLTQSRGIPLHLDAAQAWGKLPVQVSGMGAQYIAFSGHKIGGLAGTGVLWVETENPVYGSLLGKQEKGRRGGTENLLGFVALGAAASAIDPISWSQRVTPLRDRLQRFICETIPGTEVNGGGASRIGNTLNLSFQGVEGAGLVMALDLAGFSVSSGSACSSGVLEPSHVLMAMGRTQKQAMAALRISLPDEMPWDGLQQFVESLQQIVTRVRNLS